MKKKSLILLSLISLIVIGSVAGYFIYQNYINKNSQNETVNEQPKDETANWKTYKNEKYGFEIKYPSNLFLNESDITEIVDGSRPVVDMPSRNIGAPLEMEVNDYWISIVSYQKDQEGNLESWVREKIKEWPTWENTNPLMGTENYNGKNMVKVGTTQLKREGSEAGFVSNYYVEKNKNVFEIELLTLTENTNIKYLSILDNIARSFK
ncbi:hypothetical protein COX95_04040 [bacterium CG_4_10_14_0_2_um_filter_33_32]|nr:MAG: hypothetical protein AUJ93_01565 [bacterium CG2_30_33_46]PIR67475.1 MAG: hypothetical protein COU50_02965 [bacterium CG10_big_fil_rev_8_21_14_0_10_33_18]PIU76993.1 MAG: hypothetical protein COS74_01025 [bacterium CG06_land_8_20_14_3_00_33_50]PIW81769.1 MAG: hypothetical protein COZ97_00160 [bacterium CG_4_8_14_3_um_filter_33_28]PIY85849.1 MAG: hypothetical protein COY76_00135 [bacterium CG_4_10_14_0_8_um_filter_33_57]PIZ85440.1 MAG: hypothetical protein COX95_04040 [bacterium CG_4_10_1